MAKLHFPRRRAQPAFGLPVRGGGLSVRLRADLRGRKASKTAWKRDEEPFDAGYEFLLFHGSLRDSQNVGASPEGTEERLFQRTSCHCRFLSFAPWTCGWNGYLSAFSQVFPRKYTRKSLKTYKFVATITYWILLKDILDQKKLNEGRTLTFFMLSWEHFWKSA